MDKFRRQIPSTTNCILQDNYEFFKWSAANLELADSLDLYQIGPHENEALRPFLPAVFNMMAMVGLSPSIKVVYDLDVINHFD